MESNVTNENIDCIEKLKTNMKHVRKHKIQGHVKRYRAQIIENDGKPTNYFTRSKRVGLQVLTTLAKGPSPLIYLEPFANVVRTCSTTLLLLVAYLCIYICNVI